MQEADRLRAWDGAGAVRIDAMVGESSTPLLEPGSALSQVLPPSSRTPWWPAPSRPSSSGRAAGELDQITRVRALSDRVAINPPLTAEPPPASNAWPA
jgi:hypothetical protein